MVFMGRIHNTADLLNKTLAAFAVNISSELVTTSERARVAADLKLFPLSTTEHISLKARLTARVQKGSQEKDTKYQQNCMCYDRNSRNLKRPCNHSDITWVSIVKSSGLRM